MFNKAAIKCFAALWCGLIGFLFICIAQPAASQTAYAQTQAQAAATPTPSAGNATITFSIPGASTNSGHAGTRLTVSGQGFNVSTTGTTTVTVYATPNRHQCVNGGTLYELSTTFTTVQADGTFSIDVRWPHGQAANNPPEDPGTAYYICAISTMNENVVSSQTFTVAPALTATPSSAKLNPGDSVTITGTNWIPPEMLTVSLISPSNGQAITQQTATPDQDGTFSVTLTLDSTIQPGQYDIAVATTNDPQGPQYQNPNPITVIAAGATPTATATVTPTPTATSTVTPTPTATATTGTGNNNGNSSGGSGSGAMTALIFVLGGLGVLMVITGVIMFAASAPPTRRAS